MVINVNALPSVILIDILAHVAKDTQQQQQPHEDNISHWSRCRILLAVCRKWRHLALPIAHRVVSIDYDKHLQTNIDSINSSVTHAPPRTVSIRVTSKEELPYSQLRATMDLLQKNSALLQSVTCLDMGIYVIPFYGTFRDYIHVSDLARELSEAMKNLLPNITTFYFHTRTEPGTAATLGSALFNHYAPQLSCVKMSSSIQPGDRKFTNTLTRLCLTQHSSSGLPNQFDVTNLTMLELHVPDRFHNWSIFYSRDVADSTVLRFPALQHMSVIVDTISKNTDSYAYNNRSATEDQRNMFEHQLEMPRLQFLKVSAICPLTLSLLASITSPFEVQKLWLKNLKYTDLILYCFALSAESKRVFMNYFKIAESNTPIDVVAFVSDLQSIGNQS